MINKIIVIIDRCINIVIVLFLFLLGFISVYALYDTYHIYEETEISDELKLLKPEGDTDDLSYDKLKAINPDIVGWIRLNDTRIDYPILQGKDNTSYLTKDYKKEDSVSGSIFLDYRNNSLFEDDYSVIYGHNMYYKGMFSDIRNYKKKDYFEKHLKGKLYFEKGKYDVEIISFSIINAFDDIPYNLYVFQKNHNNEVINYFMNHANNRQNIEVSNDDKLLLLSTCSVTLEEERMVLLAKLSSFQPNS